MAVNADTWKIIKSISAIRMKNGRDVSLLTKLCPSRTCSFALHSVALSMGAIAELIYAGINPNEMRFKRFGCVDVWVRCGGWCHIVMEVRVEDRKKAG